MGRKGVSKRKPNQVKVKSPAKDTASDAGPAVGRTPGIDPGSAFAIRGGIKHPADAKKNSRNH